MFKIHDFLNFAKISGLYNSKYFLLKKNICQFFLSVRNFQNFVLGGSATSLEFSTPNQVITHIQQKSNYRLPQIRTRVLSGSWSVVRFLSIKFLSTANFESISHVLRNNSISATAHTTILICQANWIH